MVLFNKLLTGIKSISLKMGTFSMFHMKNGQKFRACQKDTHRERRSSMSTNKKIALVIKGQSITIGGPDDLAKDLIGEAEKLLKWNWDVSMPVQVSGRLGFISINNSYKFRFYFDPKYPLIVGGELITLFKILTELFGCLALLSHYSKNPKEIIELKQFDYSIFKLNKEG